jgi:DNA repair exonuclease SbcCD ATPase subunit
MIEEDYSDDDTTNSSVLDLYRSSSVSFAEKLPQERQLYKRDKICTICRIKFGITSAKKHYCKFCYRGVCSECSPIAVLHPEQNKELRICNLCYDKSLENNVKKEYELKIASNQVAKETYSNDYNKILQEVKEISDSIYKFERLIDLEKGYSDDIDGKYSYISGLVIQKKDLQQRYNALDIEKKIVFSEISEKDQEIKELTNAIQAETTTSTINKSKIYELRNRLSELQDEYSEMQRKFSKKQSTIALTDIEFKSQQALNNQAIKNFEIEVDTKKIEEMIEKVTNENESCTRKIKKLIEDKNEADVIVNNTTSTYSIDEEQRIRELRLQQRQLQGVIEKLRLDIKVMKSKNDPKELKYTDKDQEEDNIIKDTTRPCARCLIT